MVKRYPVLGDWLEQRRQLLEPPHDPRDPTARVRFGQARFFSASMYTDDGQKTILGVDLTILGLQVEIAIYRELNLTMAIVPKQSLGQFGTSQGIRFHTGLGIVYVPQDKARRAFAGTGCVRNSGRGCRPGVEL